MATATRAATRMNCKKSETVAVTLKKGTSTISSWVDSRAHLHVGVVGVENSASELMQYRTFRPDFIRVVGTTGRVRGMGIFRNFFSCGE